MFTLITTLIIIACVLLTLAVLAQNSKGGGLASGFGGASTQVMGVRKTTDLLEKLTWGLASALLVLSLISNFALPSGKTTGSSLLKEQIENAPAPVQNEKMPQAPGQTAPGAPAKPQGK